MRAKSTLGDALVVLLILNIQRKRDTSIPGSLFPAAVGGCAGSAVALTLTSSSVVDGGASRRRGHGARPNGNTTRAPPTGACAAGGTLAWLCAPVTPDL